MFLDRTPLGTHARKVCLSWRRDRIVTYKTHNVKISIRAPSGIRTRDASNRTAADAHLRPRGHRDHRLYLKFSLSSVYTSMKLERLIKECACSAVDHYVTNKPYRINIQTTPFKLCFILILNSRKA
jgi:hypothetical protein